MRRLHCLLMGLWRLAGAGRKSAAFLPAPLQNLLFQWKVSVAPVESQHRSSGKSAPLQWKYNTYNMSVKSAH
ncbi:hypothetical protein Krac_0931 [Ktedonobacter racemifer DSM 44963]|uniref:Uncharacterized protein n=1 Tax=Ktedonobacter racemifer DSM 44963 TaxID=485913 RepID=D6U5S9_KTERA|nr:hypothetical protein Krac_0931 [Ktedonobacter racemifer DSM 44963]